MKKNYIKILEEGKKLRDRESTANIGGLGLRKKKTFLIQMIQISQVKMSLDGGCIMIAFLLFYGKMEKCLLETELAAIKDMKKDNLMNSKET